MLPELKSGTVVHDSQLAWRLYADGDDIISNFAIEEWRLVASDVDTEEELAGLLGSYPDRIRGLVLYSNTSGEKLAFAYLLDEGGPYNAVSFHGGGWGKSIRHSMWHFRGVVLLVEYLLLNDCDVTTYCMRENSKAVRFMSAVGFVPYCTTGDRVYMRVNIERLRSSRVYGRFLQGLAG